jgi:hypothetical protein
MSATSDRDLDDDTRETFANIGAALVGIQHLERLIDKALFYVFPGESITLEAAEDFESPDRRGLPLGRLLCELRKRATVQDTLDQVLRDYLKKRNTFVHRLTTTVGGDIRTSAGRDFVNRLSFEVHWDNIRLIRIFVAILYNWQKSIDPDPATNTELASLPEICDQFEPILGSVSNLIMPLNPDGQTKD